VVERLEVNPDKIERLRSQHTVTDLWRLSTDVALSAAELIALRMRPNMELSVFAFTTGWQLCRQCATTDQARLGFSYWHRNHQLPSVTHCAIHAEPLYTCKELHHIQSLTLPSSWIEEELASANHAELLSDWNRFVLLVDQLLKTNPELIMQWKATIHQVLEIPTQASSKHRPYFNNMLIQFEQDIGSVLLAHLFKTYQRSKKNRPNILWATLSGMSTACSLRHPIYWLVILYWLRSHLPKLGCDKNENSCAPPVPA